MNQALIELVRREVRLQGYAQIVRIFFWLI